MTPKLERHVLLSKKTEAGELGQTADDRVWSWGGIVGTLPEICLALNYKR